MLAFQRAAIRVPSTRWIRALAVSMSCDMDESLPLLFLSLSLLVRQGLRSIATSLTATLGTYLQPVYRIGYGHLALPRPLSKAIIDLLHITNSLLDFLALSLNLGHHNITKVHLEGARLIRRSERPARDPQECARFDHYHTGLVASYLVTAVTIFQ